MVVAPRIKICCIAGVEEAEMAIRWGASAIGLVSQMPSGPGVIDELTISRVADSAPPGVATFLLTSLRDVAGIVAQQKRCRANTIQIVDSLEDGEYEHLKAAMPGIGIVQVIHVTDEGSVDQACEIAPKVHGLLLDSGNPNLAVKELGGTGRTHNWQISRKIVDAVDCPVYLAGGLRPENVAEAIEIVRPFGLDLCTGVRTNGRLDESKLVAFMNEVNRTGGRCD